jgi:hypothetical protein
MRQVLERRPLAWFGSALEGLGVERLEAAEQVIDGLLQAPRRLVSSASH